MPTTIKTDRLGFRVWRWGFILGAWCLLILILAAAPASAFPVGRPVTINQGAGLEPVAIELRAAGVIRSATLFEILARFSGQAATLKAGDYFFEQPLPAWTVLGRLSDGVYTTNPLKVTIPEGLTLREMASLLGSRLPLFQADHFLTLGQNLEGRLLPDTYFFSPLIDEAGVIKLMTANFDRQLTPLVEEVAQSGRTLDQVITMASILEKEAHRDQDRRLIAGILWKRIADDMPLQVDAVFPYIIGKNSFNLSLKDLKTDSPYNTYTNKGLPPGPISNPGLDAILAALRPETSPYWFYLSDLGGTMHYAINYADHLQNKKRYLP